MVQLRLVCRFCRDIATGIDTDVKLQQPMNARPGMRATKGSETVRNWEQPWNALAPTTRAVRDTDRNARHSRKARAPMDSTTGIEMRESP